MPQSRAGPHRTRAVEGATHKSVNKKRGLGRGLDALLGDSGAEDRSAFAQQADRGTVSGFANLAVDEIFRSRYQARQDIAEEGIEKMAASIKTQGLIQPIVVRPRADGGYELIAGERRWRAAQLAGLDHVPAVVKDVDDHEALAMGLIENIQREDLNPLEEAFALHRLADEFEMTQQQVADAVGKSRTAVTNLLRLLNLSGVAREFLQSGALEMGHARALLTLSSADQERVARLVVSRGLSVRQTEAFVRRIQTDGPSTTIASIDPDTRRLERELSEKLGAAVAISHNAKGKGRLVIKYTSLDELEGILRHLR